MAELTVEKLKELLVENCMLRVDPASITEETPLFGPEGIGLDSLDALQIVTAVEKNYGVRIEDAQTARDALQSLGVLRDWTARQLLSQQAEPQ
jgi:acyl carrier protein